MSKSVKGVLLDMIELDRSSSVPLYLQLDQRIRDAVLSGALVKGVRLPATRQLAQDLGLSRLTVQNTYEQLVAEGFLASSVGSGTYVAEIPLDALPVSPDTSKAAPQGTEIRLSRRGQEIAETAASTRIGKTKAFRPGVPAADLFPMKTWIKLWGQALQEVGNEMFGYGPLGGHYPLREAIAAHLSNARGVNCRADQVIVTSGAQQAFELAALTLLDPGDVAWVEHPGHTAGRDILGALGAKVVSVGLDSEGLDLARARSKSSVPRMIFVTPSHQHPLGATMSLRRRLALLKHAEDNGTWILEDDYDSEFRYSGRPLPALQGLDRANRVIYAGSFSKVLYPSLRLGYAVVPPDLIDAFLAAQVLVGHGTPLVPQVVLAKFMNSGGLATHIRKMRVAYAARQGLLLNSLHRRAHPLLTVEPTDAGMHVMAFLPPHMDDRTAAESLWAAGIETVPLSVYCATPYDRQGLLLGFTGVPPAEIDPGVEKLVRVLANLDRTKMPGS